MHTSYTEVMCTMYLHMYVRLGLSSLFLSLPSSILLLRRYLGSGLRDKKPDAGLWETWYSAGEGIKEKKKKKGGRGAGKKENVSLHRRRGAKRRYTDLMFLRFTRTTSDSPLGFATRRLERFLIVILECCFVHYVGV